MTAPARDPLPRGLRVAGMFAFMIGAGIVLESSVPWSGAAMALVGLGIFVGGFVANGRRAVLAEKVREEP